ncbi:MAG: F0F1 ATP synthase subunit A [Patescibacteria group bacterium]
MEIPPVAAEPLFHIGSFPITNAYINSTLAVILFVTIAVIIRTRIKDKPGRLQNAAEMVLEFLLGFFDQVTNDRAKSKRFFPIVGTLFLFILVSNWMGLLPGTGTIGIWQMHKGEMLLVPFLRSANSDLNLTLAMAFVAVIGSHLIGIFTIGFFAHWNKFIQIGTLYRAIVSLKPMNIVTAVIEFVVGLIELMSEVAKVISLSLRLFGNIFAGEVLITVISSLISFGVPVPFMFLEIIVGIVQATVFSLLTLVYLTIATTKPEHGDEHETAPAH